MTKLKVLTLLIALLIMQGCAQLTRNNLYDPNFNGDIPRVTHMAIQVGNQELTVSWPLPQESGVQGVNLYRSTDDGAYVKVNTTVLTGSSYTDQHLLNFHTYSYYLTVVTMLGIEGSGCTPISSSPDDGAPVAPAGLVGMVLDKSCLLRWSANSESDVVGYHVYMRPNSNSNFSKITTQPLSANMLQVTDLINGQDYYFAVSALDARQHESALSTPLRVRPEAPISIPITIIPPDGSGSNQLSSVGLSLTATNNANSALISIGLTGANAANSDAVTSINLNARNVTINETISIGFSFSQ